MIQISTEEIKKQTAENEEEIIEEKAAAEAEAPETEETAESTAEETSESVEKKPEEKKAEAKGKKKKADKKEEAEKEAPEQKAPAAEPEADDRYLRLYAEYDNYRKRTQKEKDSLYAEVKAKIVQDFLPVYDNLDRALKQNTEDEAYRKGVEMIMTQFCDTLKKLGVEEIECLGKPFDPAFCNAVMHVDDESLGENEVAEVFQKGFKAGDKIIRFAMVKVAN